MELNGYKTSICKQTPGDAVYVIGLKATDYICYIDQ